MGQRVLIFLTRVDGIGLCLQLSGELQYGIELPDLEGVSGATQLAFLPDGLTLAALCTDGGVRFVDVKEGKVVAEVRLPTSCLHLPLLGNVKRASDQPPACCASSAPSLR